MPAAAPAPFDPADPHDIVCDHFRKATVELFSKAGRIALFREMEPEDQVSCWCAGVLTGVLGVLFAVGADRDAAVSALVTALEGPIRMQAEGILDRAEGE